MEETLGPFVRTMPLPKAPEAPEGTKHEHEPKARQCNNHPTHRRQAQQTQSQAQAPVLIGIWPIRKNELLEASVPIQSLGIVKQSTKSTQRYLEQRGDYGHCECLKRISESS